MALRRAYLGLGSNLGDRLERLQSAVDGLAAAEGVTVVAVSPVYETEPVGPPQPDYLNAVVSIDTQLTPRQLLEVARRLEAEAGRVRGERWGSRSLDVDLLLVGDEEVCETDLVVPHPRLRERAFVLAPLSDLAPDLVDVPTAGWAGVRRTELALRVTE
ncbi:MAG: 2-amino-4-hydroxy-6-hydroxymethyldihydropteridine diphosphokinase [Acidimicrobiia bacterium]|nr:2-amino-4-hydroxy-6-hydroxymethyldihydropteridine diphosphokinase [Acidimicrobiia bacterium]